MGLFDVDEFEDIEVIIDNNYERVDENVILSNAEEALSLVGKIINISKDSKENKRTIDKLESLIDEDFLAPFKRVKLSNEAQIQVQLSQICDKLKEQKKYAALKNRAVVGIGGKFSAGKSKFINSILRAGDELLPEDQNPTTSIPTYIVYGEKVEISAYTRNNEKVFLTVDEMQALTHKFFEKYKMGFSSFIDSLIVSEPDLPYKKLVFLDTPGYSKADIVGKSKTQKELSDQNRAYKQLRGVDYLIWLVDIENGVLSESDIDFITKVGPCMPILIVANKSDKKDDAEIPNILNVIEESARNAGIKLFGVTAYSSRDNFEWGGEKKIEEYLNKAMKKPSNREDIIAEIDGIDRKIMSELQTKIENKIKERNELSQIIFKSNNILEIKTLVDLYGDAMEDLRDMRKCRTSYQRTIRKIRNTLEIK